MGQNWDIGKRDASELAIVIRHACEVPPQIVGMGRDLQKTWSEFDELTTVKRCILGYNHFTMGYNI